MDNKIIIAIVIVIAILLAYYYMTKENASTIEYSLAAGGIPIMGGVQRIHSVSSLSPSISSQISSV